MDSMSNRNKLGLATAGLLLAILALIVLHAPITVVFGVLYPGIELFIKAWKECLLLLVAALVLWGLFRQKRLKELVNDRLSLLLLAYIFVNFLSVILLWNGEFPVIAGLMINLRFIVYFLLVYWTLKLYPQYARLFKLVFLAGATVVVTFGVLQVTVLPADILRYIGYGVDTILPYQTIDLNSDFVRINSTLRGPNPLGAYSIVVLSVVAAVLVARWRTIRSNKWLCAGLLALLAGGVLVLWVSYSRSAWIGAFVAFVTLVVLLGAKKVSPKLLLAGMASVCLVAGVGIYIARDSAFVSNVFFHENHDSPTDAKSNDQHLASLTLGLDRLATQPIGAGVGSTGTPSLFGDQPLIIENQYLYIAHETGWLGLATFMTILLIVLMRLRRGPPDAWGAAVFASGIGLSVVGLIQPVWMDDTVSLVWWGMAAVVLSTQGVKKAKIAKNMSIY